MLPNEIGISQIECNAITNIKNLRKLIFVQSSTVNCFSPFTATKPAPAIAVQTVCPRSARTARIKRVYIMVLSEPLNIKLEKA